jgi:acetyl-CoA carboxylase biotin carboxylase subunit
MEFLLDGDGTLRFMEMNTRLQVEHCVSEMRSGVDLVREQMRVAAGHRLSFTQADITLAATPSSAASTPRTPARGSARARARAHALRAPGARRGARGHAREAGYEVPPHYDSLLCKVIAHGATRDAAATACSWRSSELVCEGVPTTVPMHRAILALGRLSREPLRHPGIPGWPASQAR